MTRSRRRRLGLVSSALAMCLGTPAAAHAQLDTRVAVGGSYPPQQVPVVELLADRSSVHADSRSGGENHVQVILFAARVSNGRLMEQGRTDAFPLNLETSASPGGVRLGSVVSRQQLLALAPVAKLGKAVVSHHATTREPVSAAELLARPSAVLTAVEAANLGALQGGSVLVVAVVPADEGLRARSKAGLLFVVGSPTGGD